MTERSEMLKKVQQLNFVMIDAGLFLNNQPESPAALELFRKYQELHRKAGLRRHSHRAGRMVLDSQAMAVGSGGLGYVEV